MQTPWQVRYVRWWWAREGRRHRLLFKEGGPHAAWHRGQAQQAFAYARNARPFWLTTGKIPLVVAPQPPAFWLDGEPRDSL